MAADRNSIEYTAVSGIVDVEPGLDLGREISRALRSNHIELVPYDVLVVAQKIVSKSAGRLVDLAAVTPSARALDLARVTDKDPRLVEVILGESVEVIRAAPRVLIVRHRLGFVMANAGIDASNVKSAALHEPVLLLPTDPDADATRLREYLRATLTSELGVIISDSFGRPWRRGVVNVALGAAGLPSLIDRRGEQDRYGRPLQMTEVGFADAIAAGAALTMGEAAEGVPVVHVRGLHWAAPDRPAAALLRDVAEDLFR
jgi:coenzyme F420-0:L-glutamate ligase / coenzyme F420-1:gamma-L-glutamate ligase